MIPFLGSGLRAVCLICIENFRSPKMSTATTTFNEVVVGLHYTNLYICQAALAFLTSLFYGREAKNDGVVKLYLLPANI